MNILGFLIVFLCIATTGFAQSKPFTKFLVYQDKPSANHYVISGFMPDGECVEMNDIWQEKCYEGRSCIKAYFGRECAIMHQAWAGVYWLQPANNWGDKKGGFDLTGASRLVFWAKGETGNEVISFKVGGVGAGSSFPDSDSAASDPIKLTTEWKEYSIDLRGKNLSRIAGGFAWMAHVRDNPANSTFYLDNIYFE